ncbi:hypothetical protein LA329_05235 [Corynebacterium falsenii]|uniref:hypothetical protein n=1 Tax=Corynebacterium falsenii TaxID=108486 RepID=UPI001CCEF378|nr:hypothetical protein [Corynebacterium falsenii]UBI07701.1 hypothetical protein LA329_05235 [Corynebacterium falsenii]
MAKKMTKRERIEQKIADGLSRLDAEIEIAKEDAAERIARLERRQARERARIEARAVEIIRRDFADAWTHAEDAARAELDAERAKRSEARRRAAESSRTDEPQLAIGDGRRLMPASRRDSAKPNSRRCRRRSRQRSTAALRAAQRSSQSSVPRSTTSE